MVLLAFKLKFNYWVAPKHVPQHVAALWDLFSLEENKKQLTDWTLSVPKVHNAANGTGSDQVKLVTFAVRFTHKNVTYDDVKQARTIFEKAHKTCSAIVWKLPSTAEPMSGLLRFDKILRCTFSLQNNPTTTSGFWGEWGLISVYYRCTSPDDGSALAQLEKFMEYEEVCCPKQPPWPPLSADEKQRMPKRNNNLAAPSSDYGLGRLKTLTSDAGNNYKLVKKGSYRLMDTRAVADAAGLNSTVRAAVQSHCDILDCMQATDVAAGRFGKLLGELTDMIASFMELMKDMDMHKRPTPWWKPFGGDHADKMNRTMTKLINRTRELGTKAQALQLLFTHLDSGVKQHAATSRRLVLSSHLQIQWRKLVDILIQPGADTSELSSLFGASIPSMANVDKREDELEWSMRRFKKGERALCSQERLFVKLAAQLDGELEKLLRDYRQARQKFHRAEVRVSGFKMAMKGKDMDWDSDSACSDDTLCEKKQ